MGTGDPQAFAEAWAAMSDRALAASLRASHTTPSGRLRPRGSRAEKASIRAFLRNVERKEA